MNYWSRKALSENQTWKGIKTKISLRRNGNEKTLELIKIKSI
jgi:hypothetical protein